MMRLVFSLGFALIIGGCSSSTISGAPSFVWPVKNGRLTQKFKNGSKRHHGIDIGKSKNTPIYAAAAGRVLYTGRDFSGYGNLLIIEHRGDTWSSFYGHLNSFKVKEGQRVSTGQTIGYMGSTGRATGVHLHFEIRYNKRPVDPLDYLPSHLSLTSIF